MYGIQALESGEEEDSVCERPLLKVNRRHCPHCDRYVSIKTFKAHKRLHFDPGSSTWSVCFHEATSQSDNDSDSPPSSIGHLPSESDHYDDAERYSELEFEENEISSEEEDSGESIASVRVYHPYSLK